jgi:spore coat protein U-like protein
MNLNRWITTSLAALGIPAALTHAPLAHAATTTSTFNVTASVENACSVSGTDLSFGAYTPTSTSALTSTSTISVLCTLNNPYNIRLNSGQNGSSVSSRLMSNGNNYTLGYALFRDAAYTQNWGETDGTNTVSSTGTGANQDFTVYGRIAALQNVPAGSYSDQITITVNF